MASDSNNSNFIELVEACRPDSDDLRAAEFASAAERIARDAASRHFYERVQQTDARLAIAFNDVPVPAGLVERLLAAVEVGPPVQPAGEHPAPRVELRPWPNLRRVGLRLAIAASLLAVIGGGLLLVSSLTPYSNHQCLTEAVQAGAQLKPQRWTNIRSTPAPAARLPLTRVQGVVKSWQPVMLLGDQQAVAYRYTNGATLLVCQPSKAAPALPIAPPSTPQLKAAASSGTHVAAWTSGGLVHVLMVSGPIDEYRRMTGATRPVVAHARPQSLPNRYDG